MGTVQIICINKYIEKYRIIWGKGSRDYVNIAHKPSLPEVKELVIDSINKSVAYNILEGLIWNGYTVYLSQENQFNYKAAYDLAVQTNGANLPVVFKFGSVDNPIYYTFETLEELSDFYLKAIAHINEQLKIGWEKKDSIDWEEYKRILDTLM